MTNRKRKTKYRQNLKNTVATGQKPADQLTDRQKEAVRMLCIDGMKVQDVAKNLGVHRCTIWRWSRKKEFEKQWNRILKAYIREQREKSGVYQRRKEHRKQLRKLEKEMNAEAARIKAGHIERLVPLKTERWGQRP